MARCIGRCVKRVELRRQLSAAIPWADQAYCQAKANSVSVKGSETVVLPIPGVPNLALEIGLTGYCATLFSTTEPLAAWIVPKNWFEMITEGAKVWSATDPLALLEVKTPPPLKPAPPLAMEVFPVAEPNHEMPSLLLNNAELLLTVPPPPIPSKPLALAWQRVTIRIVS